MLTFSTAFNFRTIKLGDGHGIFSENNLVHIDGGDSAGCQRSSVCSKQRGHRLFNDDGRFTELIKQQRRV